MNRAPPRISLGLFALTVFYGGMVPLGGVLGVKQVPLGPVAGLGSLFGLPPLSVEAGIFPFLTLIAVSSGVAELYGKRTADRLVRFGFVPLIFAILLTLLVLWLPTDPSMFPPAQPAFPIVLGQSWRMMGAGVIAYGTSATLNVWLFNRLRDSTGRFAGLRGFIAAALSQIVDTLLFISLSFYGEREIGSLMLGQMLAKIVLSAVLVPVIIWVVVRIGQRLDQGEA